MKDMSRATRRHHAARIKAARRYYYGRDNRTEPVRLGRLVHTAAVCSCWMCGHRRLHWGPKLPELLHAVTLGEES